MYGNKNKKNRSAKYISRSNVIINTPRRSCWKRLNRKTVYVLFPHKISRVCVRIDQRNVITLMRFFIFLFSTWIAPSTDN